MPEFLVFASRTGQSQSQLKPIGQAEVMKRLLTICPLAFIDMPTAHQFLDVLGKLAKQCRAFNLETGTDLVGNHQHTSEFFASIVRQ